MNQKNPNLLLGWKPFFPLVPSASVTSVEKAAKRLEEVPDQFYGTTTPVNLYRTEDCKDKVRQQLAFG